MRKGNKPVDPEHTWMKRFKIAKLDPKGIKQMIQKGVIGSMPGITQEDRAKKASLVSMSKLELMEQRRNFFENTSALLEMQDFLQDAKFRD